MYIDNRSRPGVVAPPQPLKNFLYIIFGERILILSAKKYPLFFQLTDTFLLLPAWLISNVTFDYLGNFGGAAIVNE